MGCSFSDCPPWAHKAREMPREDFRPEVEKELICFKILQEPNSGDRAGAGDCSADAGLRQVPRLLPGDNLCRLLGRAIFDDHNPEMSTYSMTRFLLMRSLWSVVERSPSCIQLQCLIASSWITQPCELLPEGQLATSVPGVEAAIRNSTVGVVVKAAKPSPHPVAL